MPDPNLPNQDGRGFLLRELLAKIQGVKPAGDEDLEAREAIAKIASQEAQNDGLTQYYKLRRHWAYYLMIVFGLSVIFQGIFIVLVGCSVLKFTGHEVFLNTVGAELFLQIAAMCMIVVRCLFPTAQDKEKDKRERPKGKEPHVKERSGGESPDEIDSSHFRTSPT